MCYEETESVPYCPLQKLATLASTMCIRRILRPFQTFEVANKKQVESLMLMLTMHYSQYTSDICKHYLMF